MIIYLASTEPRTVFQCMKLSINGANILLSNYDLSDKCPIPFRKKTWEMITKGEFYENKEAKIG
ncbi:MAG: hypothetical protein WC428_06220 [Candidatus Paceibacterota bacterium]